MPRTLESLKPKTSDLALEKIDHEIEYHHICIRDLIRIKQALLEGKAGLAPGDIIKWGRGEVKFYGKVGGVVFWGGKPGMIRAHPRKTDGTYSKSIRQVFYSDQWEKVEE